MNFDNGYIGKIPVPTISLEKQKEVSSLVEEIISTKKQSTEDDTSALEADMDQKIFEIYGLSDEEVRIIENRKWFSLSG